MSWEYFREQFEPELRGLAEFHMALLSESGIPQSAIGQSVRILLAGGKRLRPYLTWLGYAIGGGTPHPQLLRFCASLELLHAFALTHDDIIDRGDRRHGVETVQIHIGREMRDQQRLGDLPHLANGQAILVGDLLLNWSHETFAYGRELRAGGFPEAFRLFIQTVNEVLIGEMLDVDLMTLKFANLEQIRRKTLLKTARYSFVGPLRIGHSLSPNGKDGAASEFYERFGTEIGMAYQLQDDLLDIVGDPEKLDKPTGQDLRQHTVFSHCLHVNDAPDILTYERSGALAFGTRMIDDHVSKATEMIAQAPLPEAGRTALQTLVHMLSNRQR